MEECILDQLLYTWSDIGLGNMSVGHRVRAASPGLQNIHGERYRNVDRYLRYQLPFDINPNALSPQDAPICLSLIDTDRERLLVHKVYKGRDYQGRPGLYFTHLLAGLPREVTAREAILLWHAKNLWITDQNQLDPRQLRLPQLSVGDLDKQQRLIWNTFDLGHLEAALGLALVHYLQPSPPGRLYLSGSSESIATIIWGITQSLPRAPLRDMTFSTYENDPTSSEETIVGPFSEHYVPPLSPRDVSINVDAVSTPLPTKVEASAGRYITFAVQALKQRHLLSIMDDPLYRFIAAAEQQSVGNPRELLTLFQQYRGERSSAQPPVPAKPTRIPLPTPGDYAPQESPVPVRIIHEPNPQDGDAREVAVQPRHSRLVGSPLTVASQFRIELEQARPLRTLHRGVRLSLLLNVALLLFLLALLIFLPFDQNAVRQEAVNNVLTQTANAIQVAQAQMQATRVAATATAQARGAKGNSVKFLYTSPLTPVTNGQTIALYIAVQNTGQNTWSNEAGYHLACVDPQDPDCMQANFSKLMGQSFPPGGTYVFIITIKAHFANPPSPDQTPHMFDVSLAQGKQLFGDKKTLSYSVKQ